MIYFWVLFDIIRNLYISHWCCTYLLRRQSSQYRVMLSSASAQQPASWNQPSQSLARFNVDFRIGKPRSLLHISIERIFPRRYISNSHQRGQCQRSCPAELTRLMFCRFLLRLQFNSKINMYYDWVKTPLLLNFPSKLGSSSHPERFLCLSSESLCFPYFVHRTSKNLPVTPIYDFGECFRRLKLELASELDESPRLVSKREYELPQLKTFSRFRKALQLQLKNSWLRGLHDARLSSGGFSSTLYNCLTNRTAREDGVCKLFPMIVQSARILSIIRMKYIALKFKFENSPAEESSSRIVWGQ